MKRICLLALVISMAMCILMSGCGSEKTAVNDLDKMQENSLSISNYSYKYYRDVNGEATEGLVQYMDGNIRFEVYGSDAGESMVEIVNIDDNHTYIYSEKSKTGEMKKTAFFSQDAPLPHDVMNCLNSDNTIILGQEEIDSQICTLYAVNEIALAGTTFSGKVWILADKGVPLALEGYRQGSERFYRYEYKEYRFDTVSPDAFIPPDDIDFTVLH